MSNNAPDYEDNLVFPPQDDQIVGEPETKLKGKVTPLSEQEINNARVEAAKLIATAVGAATYELKDQLQIKEFEFEKVKNHYEELLKHSHYLTNRVINAERERDKLRNELGLLKESIGENKGTHYTVLFLQENAELKQRLKECDRILRDCLFKIYDEAGQSYIGLEEDLQRILEKNKEMLK